MNASPALLATILSSALVFGLVVALVGTLRATWRERLQLEGSRAEALWASFHWNLIPLVLLAGVLTDWWGFQFSLLVGSTLTACSLWLLLTTTTYNGTRSALLLTSAGTATLGVATLVAMPFAFFGPQEASASVNLGTVFLVVGALLAPPLFGVLLRSLEYRRALAISGAITLIPALLSLTVHVQSPGSRGSVGTDTPQTFDVLMNPLVMAAALVFFIYAPLEGAVSKWSVAYLRSLRLKESNARMLESGFWACFIASRLAAAAILHSRGVRALPAAWDPWVLVVSAGAACVILGNLAGAVSKISAGTGILALGFCFGPILPTLIGLLFAGCENNAIPDMRGTAFGAMFAVGSLGAVVLVPLFDVDVDRSSPHKSLRIPIVLGVLLMLVALSFALLLET